MGALDVPWLTKFDNIVHEDDISAAEREGLGRVLHVAPGAGREQVLDRELLVASEDQVVDVEDTYGLEVASRVPFHEQHRVRNVLLETQRVHAADHFSSPFQRRAGESIDVAGDIPGKHARAAETGSFGGCM